MPEIIRNRTIRPSSRHENSKSYKIDTKGISRGDTLIVNIDHESKAFHKTYKFRGADVASKDSISFRVHDFGTKIEIMWSGARPTGTAAKISKPALKPVNSNVNTGSIKTITRSVHLKTSFDPISTSDINVLILGTMPGDKSLALNEYYGHSRNKFWKIISTITNNDMPLTYIGKKALLNKTKIGIWDVAHKVNRKGSLDNAIQDEEPNDLNAFIAKHKKIKVIGFNGTRAEILFDKYFKRQSKIKYISLPSTSPANTGIDFDHICKIWKLILNY